MLCLGTTIIATLFSLFVTILADLPFFCNKEDISHYGSTSANEECIEYRLPAKSFKAFVY